MNKEEVRGLALLAGLLLGCYLLAVTMTEVMRQSQRAEVATIRADLAAWQVSQLMEEARDITRAAARERGLHP